MLQICCQQPLWPATRFLGNRFIISAIPEKGIHQCTGWPSAIQAPSNSSKSSAQLAGGPWLHLSLGVAVTCATHSCSSVSSRRNPPVRSALMTYSSCRRCYLTSASGKDHQAMLKLALREGLSCCSRGQAAILHHCYGVHTHSGRLLGFPRAHLCRAS